MPVCLLASLLHLPVVFTLVGSSHVSITVWMTLSPPSGGHTQVHKVRPVGETFVDLARVAGGEGYFLPK